MKRYYFGQPEFGDNGITAWADVEGGFIIDFGIALPSDSPKWLGAVVTEGFDEIIACDMIDAQDADKEATKDDADYHKDI